MTERLLKREFERFGEVKMVKIVKEKEEAEKPRGYAFIEFERERDVKGKTNIIVVIHHLLYYNSCVYGC